MITLARVGRELWHAVERDLLSLGFRESDIGTKLSVWELISIVIASPPSSALYHAEYGGWSQTDHLLANLGEQQAGLLQLSSRHPRPGVEYFEPPEMSTNERPYNDVRMDVMTVDELKQKRAEHLACMGVG
jgi:hypothetical protein